MFSSHEILINCKYMILTLLAVDATAALVNHMTPAGRNVVSTSAYFIVSSLSPRFVKVGVREAKRKDGTYQPNYTIT